MVIFAEAVNCIIHLVDNAAIDPREIISLVSVLLIGGTCGLVTIID